MFKCLSWPPLWSSGQSSRLQIQRSGFDSRRYQIFWGVVSVERGPLSLVSTTEKLHGRKSSGSVLEIREYGRRDPSHRPRDTHYHQTLAPTSPTRGGHSIGIVRSRTEATELNDCHYPLKYDLQPYCWDDWVRGFGEIIASYSENNLALRITQNEHT
jgi:hypothetical protein